MKRQVKHLMRKYKGDKSPSYQTAVRTPNSPPVHSLISPSRRGHIQTSAMLYQRLSTREAVAKTETVDLTYSDTESPPYPSMQQPPLQGRGANRNTIQQHYGDNYRGAFSVNQPFENGPEGNVMYPRRDVLYNEQNDQNEQIVGSAFHGQGRENQPPRDGYGDYSSPRVSMQITSHCMPPNIRPGNEPSTAMHSHGPFMQEERLGQKSHSRATLQPLMGYEWEYHWRQRSDQSKNVKRDVGPSQKGSSKPSRGTVLPLATSRGSKSSVKGGYRKVPAVSADGPVSVVASFHGVGEPEPAKQGFCNLEETPKLETAVDAPDLVPKGDVVTTRLHKNEIKLGVDGSGEKSFIKCKVAPTSDPALSVREPRGMGSITDEFLDRADFFQIAKDPILPLVQEKINPQEMETADGMMETSVQYGDTFVQNDTTVIENSALGAGATGQGEGAIGQDKVISPKGSENRSQVEFDISTTHSVPSVDSVVKMYEGPSSVSLSEVPKARLPDAVAGDAVTMSLSPYVVAEFDHNFSGTIGKIGVS